MESYLVVFKSKLNNSYVPIRLYSHYTCLWGGNSGEGKTNFLSDIREGIKFGDVEVVLSSSNISFTTATSDTVEVMLGNPKRHVILIDEVTANSEHLIAKIHESHHIFLCISRASDPALLYPYKGIYSLKQTEGLDVTTGESYINYDIQPVTGMLRIAELSDFAKPFDYIVTESAKDRSEYELLSRYVNNLVPSGGSSRIAKQLNILRGKRVLVLTDLGNIGSNLRLLAKRCLQNSNLYFYDYQCFEPLLYSSKLLANNRSCVSSISPFDVKTLEVMYEKRLEEETRGTALEYNHGKPLSKDFLSTENFSNVFSSYVGRGLKLYISKLVGMFKFK